MKQKLSDYIAAFLAGLGIRHVFIVSGGASIHILHSLHNCEGIEPICPHHEQAGAMSADGYARASGGLGCAVGTSGPGATNMITGIAGAWFDSIPVLYISGQVTTFRFKGNSGVRQRGFQETDIIPMVKPITKYCVQVLDPQGIRFELEKAVYIAREGRPGPVLLDIPDDVQRTVVETDYMAPFWPPAKGELRPMPLWSVVEAMCAAKRPVIVLGHGVRLSGAERWARSLAESWNLPVLTSWGAKDILPHDHPLNAGTFGTHGTRAGNFTIQNADCVLAIGARLSTRETGSRLSDWAREAKLIVIDIDGAEIRKFEKFGRKVDVSAVCDASAAIQMLMQIEDHKIGRREWLETIASWRERYPVRVAMPTVKIDPYALMETLSDIAPDNAQFFIDTGCAIAWSMQALKIKSGQRTYHDFNNTAMGWALPAAVGGALAQPGRPTICIVGDGSMMMNMQEMATIRHHGLWVKIILLDNQGYGMVRQTEDQWLGGVHVGTSTESGLGFPNFVKLANAFGIVCWEIDKASDVTDHINWLLALRVPGMLKINIPPETRVTPQVSFGFPIEDAEPHLPRPELIANMSVALTTASMGLGR